MKEIAVIFSLPLLLNISDAHAYKQDTHEDMSQAAADASVLKTDQQLLGRLGLESWDKKQTFQISLGGQKTITQHIRDGARFEDNGVRSQYHFFDPTRGTGLFGTTIPSPDWALEDKGDIGEQNFSLKDAYGRFYKALTSTSEDERMHNFGLMFENLGWVIHHIQDMAQPQHVRDDDHCDILPCRVVGKHNPSLYETYTNSVKGTSEFTTLFGAYPQVIFDQDRKFWSAGINGDDSGIADFTNTNFVSAGTNFRGAFQNGAIIAQPNARYTLPAPSPATPRFENANDLLTSIGKTPPAECTSSSGPCIMAFFSSTVTDSYRPQAGGVNSKASTASIFDQDLQLYGKWVSYPNLDMCPDPANPGTCEQIETNQVFSLNRFNFDKTHEFLIPRAVAYSAGLIDYFFRGRLQAEDVTFTDTGITLRVKNAIDPQKTPAWANETLYVANSQQQPSTLTIAYEYNDAAGKTQHGASTAVSLAAEPGGANGIMPGQASQNVYAFTLSVPVEATNVKYRLVFRGKLGKEEDAVAVGAVEPVSGFVVAPNYVPADGIAGQRVILRQSGQWRLSDKQNPEAGNIDWKGWYRNGRPTKVLSWSGPRARYFPDSGNWRKDVIYRDGEVFDYAPAIVLAAAVARDATGVEWVVAICQEGLQDVVYRRLADKADPPDPREQWVAIGRYDASAGDGASGATTYEADTPWFFNGRGNEAQTLRAWKRNSDPGYKVQHKRLRLTINEAVTDIEVVDFGNLPGFQEMVSCSGGYDACGAGAVQRNFRAQGEYVIAVDYRDDQVVLATVSLDATYADTSTVAASQDDQGHCTAPIGTIAIDHAWTEYVAWGDAKYEHYFQRDTSSVTTTGQTRSQTDEHELRWKQELYGLDLREGVYGYVYWNTNYRNVVNDQSETKTGTWTEGGEIRLGQRPPIQFHGPISFPSTTNTWTFGGSFGLCQPSQDTRYGMLEFSYPTESDGLPAVDSRGNVAASFLFRGIDDTALKGPFNYLTDGSFESTVSGAPAVGARYAPIGVVK